MTPHRRIVFSTQGPTPSECIFCKIATGKAPSFKVYEDDNYVAFLDAFPFSKGHTLVCPKKHGETMWDMEEEEIGGLFRTASRVSRAVVAAVDADGFRLVQNNGEAANQAVAHVHVHVIPVNMEDKGRFGGRRRYEDDEMKSTAAAIRSRMAGD